MKYFSHILCLGAAMAAAPLAFATPISGTIGFGGNGTYNNITEVFTAGANIGTTGGNGFVNGPAPTGPTGTLAIFTQFNPASFSSFNGFSLGSGKQVFTTTEGGETLTFKITSVLTSTIDSAGPGLTGVGVLSETGTTPYTDTTASFTLNTNSAAGTFITFNTSPLNAATPEPSSLVLLGSGLVSAAGMLIRRRRTV